MGGAVGGRELAVHIGVHRGYFSMVFGGTLYDTDFG